MTDFIRAETIEEVTDALAHFGADAQLLAGGTDLMVQLQRGEVAPRVLVHLEPVAALNGIAQSDGVRIGATATYRQLATSSAIADSYPSIAHAARLVGGWQTQSVGTIGGNIGNASPAADLLPPLMVHEANVTLRSSRGSRVMPIDQFVIGRRATAREVDELIEQVDFLDVPANTADEFVKVGRRSAMEISIVGLAVRITLDDSLQHIAEARIAVGSCGPRPFRATEAERRLIGNAASADALADSGAALRQSASPIDDPRASARYRSQLLPRVLAQAVQACWNSIVEGPRSPKNAGGGDSR